MEQGLRYIEKREEERAKLKKVKVTNPSKPENQVNFVLDKVSERYVAKYCVSSCVYKAHLEDENNPENVKIKAILSELSKLFDGIIDNVKEQCELDHPVEDKMRVMVTSNALKSPISTRLIPSGDMSAHKVLSEISKVLQSNEEIPLDRSFKIDMVALKQPRGSGKDKNQKALKVLDYSKD